jgi:hypothetical protein
LRIKAGVVRRNAAKNSDAPRYATGINSTTLSQNVYGKPGALFSVNRLSDALAQDLSFRASVSSAERWSGVPEPTNMRLPNGWGTTGNRCLYASPRLGVALQRLSRLTRFSNISTTACEGQYNQYLRSMRLYFERYNEHSGYRLAACARAKKSLDDAHGDCGRVRPTH